MLPSTSRHHGSSAASSTSSCSSSSKSHHHSSSNRHHHHHSSNHYHHHGTTTTSSSSRHHHHYVNAIPSPSGILSASSSNYKYSGSSGNSNRYINQSDLCTKIISGSYPLKSDNLEANENRLSFGSSTSSSSSTSNKSSSNETNNEIKQQQSNNQKYHNHTSACCGVEPQYSTSGNDINSTNSKKNSASSDLHQRSAIIAPGDNSMRCTLRRGRPNTPKTGLSVDYRIRKSSVPNTPECTSVKNLASNKINHTISSNDDIRVKLGSIDIKKNSLSNNNKNNKVKSKSKTSVVVTLSSSSLNTAMVQMDDDNIDKLSTANNIPPLNTSNSNLNDNNCNNESRLLDMAFNEDDIEDDDSCHSGSSSALSSSSSSSSSLLRRKLKSKNRQLSLSLSNLPQTGKQSPTNTNDNNATSVSDNVDVLLKKSSSSDLLSDTNNENKKETETNVPRIIVEEVIETEQKRDNVTRKDSINCVPNSIGTELAAISNEDKQETITDKQQIQFEPFKFKMPEIIPDDLKSNNFEFFTDKENANFLDMEENDNMLQNVLRRQSLFKLKEKINGKVSKHINEIEKRKLSPYRFANSPLKPKKMKETNLSLLSKIAHLKNHITNEETENNDSPSKTGGGGGGIFSRKILKEQSENEQYINKTKPKNMLSTTIATSTCSPKIPSDSPLIVRAKNQFYKKFSKNRSVKRLNATMTPFSTNLSSIADTSLDMSNNQTINKSVNSPTGKHLISSWKCSTESIDL